MVHVMLFPIMSVSSLRFSTSRSVCAVPNMSVFCSSLVCCFPGTLLGYFLNDFGMVPVVPVITAVTSVLTFHVRCISVVRPLRPRAGLANFLRACAEIVDNLRRNSFVFKT
jgi:hypothetical protein